MPIRVLSPHLVNKIAAGEVIERPASVVKELVENALDAGATRIDLALEDGGRRLIAVTDNGGGMGLDDLQLAFVPHATSKLADEDGLFDIRTMGFRGEALASIASISHAHIRTRRPDDVSGYEVSAAGDEVAQPKPAAGASGTTITIRNLFFNTPARRKFLRTAATELGHCTEQLTRLALPNPRVAFTLTHNGRTLQDLPAVETTAQRAADLLGRDLADGLLRVSRASDAIRIEGLIAPPSACRASTRWQYVFLNGRYVRDRLLSHALREAYRGLVDPSRSPVALVFLEIDPAEVDVNVHPTKIEVRFRDSQAVHAHLLAALRETLNRSNLAPTAQLQGQDDSVGQDAAAELPGQDKDSLRQALADFFKKVPPTQPRFDFGPRGSTAAAAQGQGQAARQVPPAPVAEDSDTSRPVGDSSLRPPLTGRYEPTEVTRQLNQPLADIAENPAADDRPQAEPSPGLSAAPQSLPPVFQVDNSYIVAACDDGLVVIDQHALHERLIYNDLRRRLADGRLEGQRMLIPLPVSVSAAEAAVLEDNADLLGRLGMELAPFGPGSWAVQQFPTLLESRRVEPAAFVRELLDRLADDETTDAERVLESLLEMMACKAAVKAGDPLSADEMHALLARRADAEKASSCPHGRPTTLQLTLRDLEKQFKRV
jgi:DNA mismatch repair protein MutL